MPTVWPLYRSALKVRTTSFRRTRPVSEQYGLRINGKKTKVSKTDKTEAQLNIQVDGEVLQEVTKFECLGSWISQDGICTPEIRKPLAIAMRTLQNLNAIRRHSSKHVKLRVPRACIFPTATYGCVSWKIKQCDAKYITAFEHKCYGKIWRVDAEKDECLY